jgi:hypothetical protein
LLSIPVSDIAPDVSFTIERRSVDNNSPGTITVNWGGMSVNTGQYDPPLVYLGSGYPSFVNPSDVGNLGPVFAWSTASLGGAVTACGHEWTTVGLAISADGLNPNQTKPYYRTCNGEYVFSFFVWTFVYSEDEYGTPSISQRVYRVVRNGNGATPTITEQGYAFGWCAAPDVHAVFNNTPTI